MSSSLGGGYVPIPSLGHELGIMFGGFGLMLVCMILYYVLWQRYQAKIALVEEDRRRELGATKLYNDDLYDEKGISKKDVQYVERK